MSGELRQAEAIFVIKRSRQRAVLPKRGYPIEQGVGHMGQELIELAAYVRKSVREDVRRALEKEPGSSIELPMEATFGCGRK